MVSLVLFPLTTHPFPDGAPFLFTLNGDISNIWTLIAFCFYNAPEYNIYQGYIYNTIPSLVRTGVGGRGTRWRARASIRVANNFRRWTATQNSCHFSDGLARPVGSPANSRVFILTAGLWCAMFGVHFVCTFVFGDTLRAESRPTRGFPFDMHFFFPDATSTGRRLASPRMFILFACWFSPTLPARAESQPARGLSFLFARVFHLTDFYFLRHVCFRRPCVRRCRRGRTPRGAP